MRYEVVLKFEGHAKVVIYSDDPAAAKKAAEEAVADAIEFGLEVPDGYEIPSQHVFVSDLEFVDGTETVIAMEGHDEDA
jgi:nucleotide-binding universal stress UspA family protein